MLRENEEYRMMFANAVYKHCFNDGALTPESVEESFLYRKNETVKAVILEPARWGDYLKATTGTTYTRNDHWLPEVEKVIRDYIPKRRNIVINQFRSSSNRLFPLVMPPLLQSEDMPLSKAKKITMSNPNLTEGDIWFTVDGSDPRMTGGRVNGRKYAGAIQVDKNTLLKARFKSKNTGEWIALAEEMFLLDASISEELVITEIMYHPDDDYPEFIELMNNGEELVLTGDTSLFYKVYGYHAYGQFSKKLGNDGETIILKNSFNLVIDSVSYSSASPWPVIPGDGYSIGLKDIISDNSLAEN